MCVADFLQESREKGRYRIVWEAEAAPTAKISSGADASTDFESMFPSEESLLAGRVSGGEPPAIDRAASASQPFPSEQTALPNTGSETDSNPVLPMPEDPASPEPVDAKVDMAAGASCPEAIHASAAVEHAELFANSAAAGQEISAPPQTSAEIPAPASKPCPVPRLNLVAGRAFYEELMAAHSAALNAHSLRAAWAPPKSHRGKFNSPRASEKSGFASFGYHPPAFEDPAGKGWVFVVVAVLALLAGGTVMAVGPGNVKGIVRRIVSAAVKHIPGPSAAVAPSAGPTPALAKDVPVSESAGSALRETAENAPATGAPQKPYAADTAETPEETEAKVRQFQREHSGASSAGYPSAPPAANGEKELLQQSQTSATSTAASPTLPGAVARDTFVQETPPPDRFHAPPLGTVAIRSHFQAIRGEESPPGGSLQIGQLASFRQPVYPVEAVRAHVEGTVELRVMVDQSGTVENIRLVSGPPLLVPTAITAVKQWRYGRTALNGRAVESVEDVSVTFRLGNSAASPG
jgi:TonB family protein